MLAKLLQKLAQIPAAKFILLIVAINFILISLAIFYYPGHFFFWAYPLSYAGWVKTVEGIPNLVSSRLYGLAMILSGITMLGLAGYFRVRQRKDFHWLLCLVATIGFLIAGFSPDDTRHTFHVIGSALFVAVLWLLATFDLYNLRTVMTPRRYFTLQLILQVPILTYALTYFLSIAPFSCAVQKFAFLGLLIILIYVFSLKEKTT